MNATTLHAPAAVLAPELLTLAQVAQLLGVSERAAHEATKREGFPPARALSPRVNRWLRSEVLAWLAALPPATEDRPARAQALRMVEARRARAATAANT